MTKISIWENRYSELIYKDIEKVICAVLGNCCNHQLLNFVHRLSEHSKRISTEIVQTVPKLGGHLCFVIVCFQISLRGYTRTVTHSPQRSSSATLNQLNPNINFLGEDCVVSGTELK